MVFSFVVPLRCVAGAGRVVVKELRTFWQYYTTKMLFCKYIYYQIFYFCKKPLQNFDKNDINNFDKINKNDETST